MGVMTTLVMNYTINPIWNGLRKFYRGLVISQEIMGYSRAAAELARLGYHQEAKNCMMKAKELRS